MKIPSRSKTYGVGKKVKHFTLMHCSYERLLPQAEIKEARRILGEYWSAAIKRDSDHYDLVGVNKDARVFVFIWTDGFNCFDEPTIVRRIKVFLDSQKVVHSARYRRFTLLHHKWLCVAKDYRGFPVERSEARSLAWLSLPFLTTKDLQCNAKWRDWWIKHVEPHLGTSRDRL